MKTTSSIMRQLVAGLSGAALLGGALMAAAQTAQDAPRRPQPPGDGQRRESGGQRPGGAQPGAALFSDPSLTDEQRQALREAFEPDREQNIELYRRLARARKELQDATFAEKSDAESIRGKGAELGKVEAELAVLRAKAIEKVRAKLSAEQLEKLKNNPMMGGGFGGMAQGMQRPGGGDFRRPGQGDDAQKRPPTQGKAQEYYRRAGGEQGEQPRRPAAPPAEEKP